MTDYCEEQEMEAEALTAIFDECFEIVSSTQPFEWAISLWPEQHSPEENHVGIKLIAKIPLDYPESSLPELDIELLKGLTDEHKVKLLSLAKEEAEANLGLPSIFTICELLREWLLENNAKGMDDLSMYAQMIRREKETEKQSVSWNVVESFCYCVVGMELFVLLALNKEKYSHSRARSIHMFIGICYVPFGLYTLSLR
jgi:hypothetical protein